MEIIEILTRSFIMWKNWIIQNDDGSLAALITCVVCSLTGYIYGYAEGNKNSDYDQLKDFFKKMDSTDKI